MAAGCVFLILVLFAISSTMAVCPDSKWGVNCEKDCHCLGGDFKCDQQTAACDSNVCQAGYLNPPTCQTPCKAGEFGDACNFQCHCANNAVCNNVNGECPNGCDAQWTGAGCLSRRTFLGTPPKVGDLTCISLQVSWPEWSKDNPVDASDISVPVVGYQLQLNVNSTGWNNEGTYRNRVVGQTMYYHSINNLRQFTKYEFRVRADGQSQYNKTVIGYPGPVSDPAYPLCTDPTAASTISPQAPGAVSDPVVVVISHEVIRISWKAPSTGGAASGYELRYTKKGIGKDGNCETVIGAPSTVLALTPDTFTRDLNNLDPWSFYEIILVGQNAMGKGSATPFSANTLETSPIGRITGLMASDVTSTSFMLTWTSFPCFQRHGELTHYVVQYTPQGGNAVTVQTTSNQILIRDLVPLTPYRTMVQFLNKHAATSFSDPIDVTTTASSTSQPGLVPAVPQSLHAAPGPTYMYASWQPPNPTNGAILDYELFYKRSVDTSYQSTVTSARAHNVTGLATGSTYVIQVRARNANGWGPYTGEVTAVLPVVSNLPGQPSPPALVDYYMRTPSMNWLAPAVTNGALRGYKVDYIRTDTIYPSATVPGGTVNTVGTSVVLDNLDPSSTYSITVSARNDNGFGAPSPATDVITYPPIPPDPRGAEFASDTQNVNTALIKVFTVTSANVAWVDVFVSVVKTAARRKRANADCSRGAFLQRRIMQNEFVNNEIDVILGDDKVYNSVNNPSLQTNERYETCSKIVSQYKNRQSYSYAKSFNTVLTTPPATQSGPNNWLILGIFLLIVLIIIFIILVILCVYLKRKKQKESPQTSIKTRLNYHYQNSYERFDETMPKIHPYGKWSDITEFSQPRRVEHVREAMDPVDPNTKTIEEEYKNLPRDQIHPWLQALKPENDVKNRFEQFLPYDHSRVNVRALDGETLYVNANYIDGFQKPRAYIAAQSPFNAETINDFWEMIYQENSQQVVMLCRPIEDGILKCETYWPDEGSRVYRHLAVTLKNTDTFANYVIRQFQVTPQKHSTKTRTVIQYQFTAWPAHGVPKDPIPYLEFVIKARAQGTPGAGPQVVHCGTGVSRTAVQIAVDSLMKEGFKNGQVNVFKFCKEMREQRIQMVRTPVQYTFIYDTLFDALMTSNYILDFDMRQGYKHLLEKNDRTGTTELLEQFKVLRYYTPQIAESLCKVALRTQNRAKNRYMNIIPPDEIRATLRTPGGVERNDYINAIFLDGHLRQKAFIVTQTPMLSTCIDFWKLVYDYKVKTIVMLHDKSYKDNTLREYWPKGKEMKRFDPFFVVTKWSVKENDFVVKRYFELSSGHSRNQKPREVKQFQLFSGWHMYDKNPDRDALLQLVDSVLDEQRRLQDEDNVEDMPPILVHCADGATRSGLFCTLMLLVEKMKYDRYVDVFHTVKHLKRSRPQFIDDFEQYKMCFKALWEHINTRFRSTYSLSRASKDSHETLDTVGDTRDSGLR